MCISSLLIAVCCGFLLNRKKDTYPSAVMESEETIFLLKVRETQYTSALILVPRFIALVMALAAPVVECELHYEWIEVPLSRYIIGETIAVMMLYTLQVIFLWQTRIKLRGLERFWSHRRLSQSFNNTRAITTFVAFILSFPGFVILVRDEPLCTNTALGVISLTVFMTSWFMALMYCVDHLALRLRRWRLHKAARKVNDALGNIVFDEDDDDEFHDARASANVVEEADKLLDRYRSQHPKRADPCITAAVVAGNKKRDAFSTTEEDAL